MISLEDFYRAYATYRPLPNRQQQDAIDTGPQEPLFIVAGPGTGKTATLTLRILKLILVDNVPPRGILATTFTKKAAAELRSRILSWGFQLQEALLADTTLVPEIRDRVRQVDINQVITGTIDSICDQLLREFRAPGTQPPVLADDFVSKTLLLREGMFRNGNYNNEPLDTLLFNLSGNNSRWDWNVGAKNDIVQEIWDRRFQDQVDWERFITSRNGTEAQALEALNDVLIGYQEGLNARGMLDFALLEQQLLDQLRQGEPAMFLDQIQVILVDEYQDTNLLQESMYFELARACDGALNVVGDDDQSLYRFRGATVELFSGFAERYERVFEQRPATIFLQTNYRSTQTIIQFVNNYATLDATYQDVRVDAKPGLHIGPSGMEGLPIFGMFRDGAEVLATDLAAFVLQVFRGDGYALPNGETLRCSPAGGDLGDCALLCSSPAEYNSGGNARLPLYLREELNQVGIQVFNPRGQNLTEIRVVERFAGLLLECLDPGGVIEEQITSLSPDMRAVFTRWRRVALEFAESPEVPDGLLNYAIGWAERNPNRPRWNWPKSVTVLDLIYGLNHFFPMLHNDPEGQIYLEVFTRQISACEQVGKFSGRVVTDPDNQGLSEASVKELLRDFLGPIAAGTVKVNEELMEAFPRDRLSLLSIHQAKGLEFPLTIVDAGAEFKTNHNAHAFKRFPSTGGRPHIMEDTLRPFSPLNAPTRSSLDRAFDDLYRQFFVAYSRPQQVLLLVSHERTFPGGIRNIATGWARDSACAWQDNRPFIQI